MELGQAKNSLHGDELGHGYCKDVESHRKQSESKNLTNQP